jgi:deoxyribodipyrimidine photolyase
VAGSLVWLRRDLRLHDNPALMAAAGRGPVIPVYIFDDTAPGWQPGARRCAPDAFATLKQSTAGANE